MLCPRLRGKVGIESQADVIVEVRRVCDSAIASLTLDQMRRTPLARILREVKVSNHCVDVAFA